jgi:ATP-dependent Clp protease ATP-binding subunit ClpA
VVEGASRAITLENVRGGLLTLVPPDAEQELPDAHGDGPFIRRARRVLEAPFTPRASSVLQKAVQEALTLGSTSIETEHILLGISREKDSVAMGILTELDAELPGIGRDIRPDLHLGRDIRTHVIRRLHRLWANK